ncbi:MAG: PadR family transcriptional regulator [Candidatus Thorarchaeota archaeon]|nr:PadR family transcriptional regulator [Candidatus Thorarchaeota archaeon]
MSPTRKVTPPQNQPDRKSLAPIPLVRALLLTLILAEPGATGYDLMKRITEFTDGRVALKTGTAYSELRRLERLGFVRTNQETGGRQKRAYKITAAGKRELQELVQQIDFRISRILMPLMDLAKSKL